MRIEQVKAIRAMIRLTRKQMKERGIRRISFMNTRLTREESDWNCKIFQLENELKDAQK